MEHIRYKKETEVVTFQGKEITLEHLSPVFTLEQEADVYKRQVLYALSALLRKCGCRWGEQTHLKRQENRAVIAWRGAASAGLVSSADRGI